MNKCLMISQEWDINAAAVSWGLAKMGIESLRVSSLIDPRLGPIALKSTHDSEWSSEYYGKENVFRSCWYRRPSVKINLKNTRECDRDYLNEEWNTLHRNVCSINDEILRCLWVNKPYSASMAENKLYQLSVARKCGLSYPDTLVSNDPVAIKDFIKSHNNVIYKSFMPHLWHNLSSDINYALYATLIDESMIGNDSSVLICPGIYQKYIDKKYDLRVTVIGNKVFSALIQSKDKLAFIDWRRHSLGENIEICDSSLPTSYKSKIMKLVRSMGLAFGCIDLAVDKNNDIFFLEINQSGHFLFIEQAAPHFPLLSAMCSMLNKGSIDYDLSNLKDISFCKYIETDHYQRFINDTEQLIKTDHLLNRQIVE